MNRGVSRRALLGLKEITRPPWALQDERFLDACTGCGDCVVACPEEILIRGRGGYPEVDFRLGGCTLCERCARACGHGALAVVDGGTPPWTHRVAFKDACIARQGVECRVCGEVCEASAIRFQPRLGAPPAPELDPARCTGCGGCISACPVAAIELSTAADVPPSA